MKKISSKKQIDLSFWQLVSFIHYFLISILFILFFFFEKKFRFADLLDKFLIMFGTLIAILTGASFPLMYFFYNSIVSTLNDVETLSLSNKPDYNTTYLIQKNDFINKWQIIIFLYFWFGRPWDSFHVLTLSSI